MDLSWIFVVLTLIVLFASISIVGALHRIRDAGEKTAHLLEQLLAAAPPRAVPPIADSEPINQARSTS